MTPQSMFKIGVGRLVPTGVRLIQPSNTTRRNREFQTPWLPAPADVFNLAGGKLVKQDSDGTRGHGAWGCAAFGYELDLALFSVNGPRQKGLAGERLAATEADEERSAALNALSTFQRGGNKNKVWHVWLDSLDRRACFRDEPDFWPLQLMSATDIMDVPKNRLHKLPHYMNC